MHVLGSCGWFWVQERLLAKESRTDALETLDVLELEKCLCPDTGNQAGFSAPTHTQVTFAGEPPLKRLAEVLATQDRCSRKRGSPRTFLREEWSQYSVCRDRPVNDR